MQFGGDEGKEEIDGIPETIIEEMEGATGKERSAFSVFSQLRILGCFG
jgi:hypothetical protein